ncbi:AraC family transcriptional regulator [Caldicellulosiruptoraceae bacterium PP1]
MSDYPVCFDDIRDLNNNKVKTCFCTYQEDPGYFIPHRHNYIEFMYVLKGEGFETINSKRHVLKPGTMSVVLPYQVHKIEYDSKNPLCIYVGAIAFEALFAPNALFFDIAKLLLDYGEEIPLAHQFNKNEMEKIELIFSELLTYSNNYDIWSELIKKAKIIEVITIFDKSRRQEKENVIKSDTLNVNPEYWNIVYYLHQHYNEDVSLKKLSNIYHLSQSYISQIFKKLVGTNFHNFLNEIRILNACALLTSTDKPITDIALEVGFDSYSTFARVFQKYKLTSAHEFRKNNQK